MLESLQRLRFIILEEFAMLEYSLFCISSRMKGYTIFGELHMIQIPGAVLARFEACLASKMSENLRSHYKKWLRFYLDFCSKYCRDANKIESLADFQQKLREEKGQTEMQQSQAAHAVSLYLDSGRASAFARLSVSSPASVLHKVEVSEIKVPMQCTARPEQQTGAVPMVPDLACR